MLACIRLRPNRRVFQGLRPWHENQLAGFSRLSLIGADRDPEIRRWRKRRFHFDEKRPTRGFGDRRGPDLGLGSFAEPDTTNAPVRLDLDQTPL